jgi:hypothetical protein
MPRGPKGEKRPPDVVANAVHVMKVLTGEAEETTSSMPNHTNGGEGGREAAGGQALSRGAQHNRSTGGETPLAEIRGGG